MIELGAAEILAALEQVLPRIAYELRPDYRALLQKAQAGACHERERLVLGYLQRNADKAEQEEIALCQDTGSVWISLEVGPDCILTSEGLVERINELVARAYTEGYLRKSMLKDAFSQRENTGTNCPAFIDIELSQKAGARLNVMLKGGGSDNASQLCMLNPTSGREGIIQAVLERVKEKAANACPPLVIGLGIGGSFDTVAHLAKKQLMRSLDVYSEDVKLAELEHELEDRIAALGIGAAALGGNHTALRVLAASAPCHIAALPLAINMGCSALRAARFFFDEEDAAFKELRYAGTLH